MTWYVHHPQLSYQDWLKLHATQAIVNDAAAKQASQIVGSVNYFRTRIISDSRSQATAADQRIEQLAFTVQQGFDQLSDQIGFISTSISDFHADFNWWSEKHSQQLNQIADLLEQLRETLSRKHRTEAFEFFQQSLEYKHHKMFDKSINCVNIAIYGDDRVRGYDLEWRFWEHLGVLQMGSDDNASPLIIDVEKAESSFLQGAQLAERNAENFAASRCFLGAAMAAYCTGNKEKAVKHGLNAIRMAPDSIEAHWQLGRHQWEEGSIDDSANSLAITLSADYRYARRFSDDPAFAEKPDLLERLKNRISQLLEKKVNITRSLTLLLKFSSTFKKLTGKEVPDIETTIKTLKSALERRSLVDLAFLTSSGPNLLERAYLTIENVKKQELEKHYERIKTREAVTKNNGIASIALMGITGAFVGVLIGGALASGVSAGMDCYPECHVSISRWMMGAGLIIGFSPALLGFVKRGNHTHLQDAERAMVRELEKC